jgi:short-subunit dehydrogenase
MPHMTTKKIGKGKTALITGASAGIGEELAVCFAKGGFDLVLVARSADKLKNLAETLAAQHGVAAVVVPADLSKPDSAKKLAAAIRRKKIAVDVLVNNAGVMEQGSFWRIPEGKQGSLIALNITSLTALINEFLPAMVERGQGRILNVASVAAFQSVPTLAVYAASKAYVLSLTESLAIELKGTGVTATVLCPGMTATNMLSKAQSSNFLKGDVPTLLVADAKSVAEEGYTACIKGEVIKVYGVLNQAAMITSRATPKWLVRRIGDTLSRKATKL